MLGFSPDDPLMVQLRGCEKTSLEAEAEAEADAEAAGHDEEEDEEQEEGAGAEEQEGEKDSGASIEMLDEVMQRLSVTFESGIYYRDNRPPPVSPPPEFACGRSIPCEGTAPSMLCRLLAHKVTAGAP